MIGEAWANFGAAGILLFAALGVAVERAGALISRRRAGTADIAAAALLVLFIARTHALGLNGLAIHLINETATAIPRALKLPVGFSSSSLIRRFAQPSAAPSRSARNRGVPPSPRGHGGHAGQGPPEHLRLEGVASRTGHPGVVHDDQDG